MNLHKDFLVEKFGQKKYDEYFETMKTIEKQEDKKGEFQAIDGDIDRRDDSLKDIELDQGFNTECGIKGSKLSGGQKQRLAIARTVIREPKVLILDEATSALDEDSQKKVQAALAKIAEDKTAIIIAHRLSTIEQCQKIFVLESGKVIEEGGFEELKNKDDGFFKNLAAGKANKAQDE